MNKYISKGMIVLFALGLGATSIVAAEKAKKNPLDFNLGVIPDLTGNIGLDTRVNLEYYESLNAGLSYTSATRGEAKTPTKAKLDLEVVDTKVYKFNALGYRINISEDWWLLPSLNGQYLAQNRKRNVTDASAQVFLQQTSRLASTQGNVDLTSSIKTGALTIFLNFGISPINVSEEATKAFDQKLITEGPPDQQGNITYFGFTGDKTLFSETSTSYLSGRVDITWANLIGDSDFNLGFRMMKIDYESDLVGKAVYNGEQVAQRSTTTYDQLDLTFTLGAELTFLGFGDLVQPFGSLTYTKSKFGDQDDNIFGVEIAFRK